MPDAVALLLPVLALAGLILALITFFRPYPPRVLVIVRNLFIASVTIGVAYVSSSSVSFSRMKDIGRASR